MTGFFCPFRYPAIGQERPGSLTAVPEVAAGTLTEKSYANGIDIAKRKKNRGPGKARTFAWRPRFEIKSPDGRRDFTNRHRR